MASSTGQPLGRSGEALQFGKSSKTFGVRRSLGLQGLVPAKTAGRNLIEADATDLDVFQPTWFKIYRSSHYQNFFGRGRPRFNQVGR